MRSDQRGAIMVLAVFFAVFGVAILFSVVGTAENVFFREKLQDAADSAALSGAVTHARAMNLLVLLNIVMAALLAILVTLKLVESLAIAGIALAAALAFITSGASLVAVPPLKVLQAKMSTAYEQLEEPIHTALETLHDTSDVILDVVPAAAQSMALAEVDYLKPQMASVQLAVQPRLPVDDDSFATLCGKAGALPFELAESALSPLPGMNRVWGMLSSAADSLASRFSEWFCGDGSGAPPGGRARTKAGRPRLDIFLACQEETQGSVDDLASLDARTAETLTCLESQRAEEQATPDEKTGECNPRHDCSPRSYYEERVQKARVDCHPYAPGQPHDYDYQQRQGSVEYVWTLAGWARGEPRYSTPERKQSLADFPCPLDAYNEAVRLSDDVDEVRPACSDEAAPDVPEAELSIGLRRTVVFMEVLHILGCNVTEFVPIQVRDAEIADGGESMAPKKLWDDAVLGDENFQVRVITSGDLAAREAERLVRLSLWSREDPDHPLASLRDLEGLAVAQAEYFYDGADGRDAWMWNMNWRGRLRRFRVPDGEPRQQLRAGCGTHEGAGSSGCRRLLDLAARNGGLLAH